MSFARYAPYSALGPPVAPFPPTPCQAANVLASPCGNPHACVAGAQPYPWPRGAGVQTVQRHNQIFPRDTHWHAEVLNERIFHLPLKVPGNDKPFIYCDATTGREENAAYSTSNLPHQHWQGARACTNVSTPIGSDSDIFFNTRGDPSTPGLRNTDKDICKCCEKYPDAMVCSPVCVDFWTNRPSPVQSTTGGCPWGTVKALSCYDCSVHQYYMKNKTGPP